MMLDLRKPFGADVFKRRRTHYTEADKEHVRLHNTHDKQITDTVPYIFFCSTHLQNCWYIGKFCWYIKYMGGPD